MENFPVNIDMYTAVVGLLLPILISTIVSPDWTKQTKGWISFALVFLAAAGHLFFIGGFDVASFPGTLLKILFLATGSYLSFWRPTGIKDAVENNVGTKPKKTNPYGEQGFAKLTFIFLLAGLMLIFSVGMACAASNVTFEWDPNSETDLAGYRLYQSQTSGQYTFGDGNQVATIAAGTETVTITNVTDGTYYWVLTAYDDNGNESGPSNEVTDTLDSTAPEPPGNMLIAAIDKMIAALQDIKSYLAQNNSQ